MIVIMKDKITKGKKTKQSHNKILKKKNCLCALRLEIIFIFLYFSGFSKINILFICRYM